MKKVLCLILSLVLISSLLAGCAGNGVKTKKTITVTDQAGRTVSIGKPAEKIVSGYYIASSACLALGLKDNIVGLEEKSETRPIYNLAAPGLTEKAVCVGNAKNFDVEACLSADPDLVILPKKAQDYAEVFDEAGVAAIVVDPEDNERLDEMIRLIAALTGKEAAGERLIKRRADLISSLAEKVLPLSVRPSVYFCNPSSFMRTAPKDLYQADLIRKAGGINAGDILDGSSWAEVSNEQVLLMDPDVIVVPCSSTASGRPDYADEIFTDELFSSLDAVKNGSVYFMPYGIESWDSPVPAGVLGTMWLTRVLHPEVISQKEFEDAVTSFYSDFYGFEVDFGELGQ